MSKANLEIRPLEYSALRTELHQNKQFIFERPLAIILAAGVGAVQFSGQPLILPLCFMLIMVLLSNLSLTVNRLKSGARIAAYIEVVLESNEFTWLGWETSLNKYREWMSRPEAKRKELIERHSCKASPDAMRFYRPVFMMHVSVVPVAIFLSALSTEWSNPYQLVGFSAIIIASGVFLILSSGPFWPTKMNCLIEEQTATWTAIFTETEEITKQNLAQQSVPADGYLRQKHAQLPTAEL